MYPHWWSYTRGISQIWLQIREESRKKILRILLYFGDLLEPIRVSRKVRKTRHQNPEFGPKPGEIKKKPVKKGTLAFQGKGGNQKCTIFRAKLSFHPVLIPSFLFPPQRLHCCYIYFPLLLHVH